MNPRGCEDAAVTWRSDAPGVVSLLLLSNQTTRGEVGHAAELRRRVSAVSLGFPVGEGGCSVNLIHCPLRAREAGRRDADPHRPRRRRADRTDDDDVSFAWQGRRRASAASYRVIGPTAPRFNNRVEGTGVVLSLPTFRLDRARSLSVGAWLPKNLARRSFGGAMPARPARAGAAAAGRRW
jgi:hypothetical protein